MNGEADNSRIYVYMHLAFKELIHKSIGVTMGNMPLRDTGQGNRQVVVSYYNPQLSYRWLQNFGSLGNQKLASF